MKHTVDPTDVKPCPHMRTLISEWMDAKLTGIKRWYTEQHIRGCAQCQASLPFLRSLQVRLRSLTSDKPPKDVEDDTRLGPEHWSAVHAAWDVLDRKHEGGEPQIRNEGESGAP
jgi:hypothetical protein